MARGGAANNVLRIIIEGDASGAEEAIAGVKQDLMDLARAKVAYEGFGFLRQVTEDAAGLIESQNAVDQVFQSSAGSVREFGETADTSLGQSEMAANQANATFGNLFTAFGVGQETAAEWSQTLVTLASDYAAFKNVDVSETLTSFQAIMAGEIEPARRMGIDVREATLIGKAREMGLIEEGEKLSALTKLQATYAQVLEDSATVSGQFARESEGLLGQQMIATAEWENAKAALGMNFIPLMTKATEVTGQAASALGELDAVQTYSLVTMAAWGVGGARVVALLGQIGNAAWNAAAAWSINGAWGPKTGPASISQMNKTTVGLSAIAAGVISYTVALEALEAVARSRTLGDDTEALATALESFGRTGEASGALDEFGTNLEGLSDAIDNLNRNKGDALEDIFGGIGKGSPLFAADQLANARAAQETIDNANDALIFLVESGKGDEARRTYGQIIATLISQGYSLEELVPLFDRYWDAVETSGLANENDAASTDENTDAKKRQTEQLRSAAQVWEDRLATFEKQRSAQEGLRSAEEGLADAAVDLAEAQKAAAGDSEEMRDALEAEADAADAVVDAKKAVTEASEAQAEAERAVADAQAEVVDRQNDLNEAREEAAEKIRDLTEAAREARMDEEEAALSAREKAREAELGEGKNLTGLERERLDFEARQAAEEAAQATRDRAEAEREAASATIEGDDGVIAAKEALADAVEGVSEAQDRVRDASERVREAQEGVADAEKRVQDAQERTVEVARAAREALVDANKAHADALLGVTEAQRDLTTAFFGTVAGTQAWRDELKRIADMYAPGSPERQNIEALINDLNRLLWAQDAFTIAQNEGVPLAVAEKAAQSRAARDAANSGPEDRSGNGWTINYSPTINGSSARERELMEQKGQDFLDQVGRMATGRR